MLTLFEYALYAFSMGGVVIVGIGSLKGIPEFSFPLEWWLSALAFHCIGGVAASYVYAMEKRTEIAKMYVATAFCDVLFLGGIILYLLFF